MATPDLFSRNPASTAVYEALIRMVHEIGPTKIEEKKTSLHVLNGRAAFLGIHPRKSGVRVNIVLARPLESARVAKAERVSANRYHNELDIREVSELDDELVGWIREAYER